MPCQGGLVLRLCKYTLLGLTENIDFSMGVCSLLFSVSLSLSVIVCKLLPPEAKDITHATCPTMHDTGSKKSDWSVSFHRCHNNNLDPASIVDIGPDVEAL
jgi:hypothetical protein